MQPPYRGPQTFVAKPAQEPRKRCGLCGGAQRFNEKNFQQTLENDLARRSLGPRLLTHELYERRQALLAPNTHQLRQQGDQQRRIRRAEYTVTHEEADIRRSAQGTQTEFSIRQPDRSHASCR